MDCGVQVINLLFYLVLVLKDKNISHNPSEIYAKIKYNKEKFFRRER